MEEKKVSVLLSKRSRNESERFISCNGRRFLVKTGISVAVPPEIAEVIENADAQRAAAEARIASLTR